MSDTSTRTERRRLTDAEQISAFLERAQSIGVDIDPQHWKLDNHWHSHKRDGAPDGTSYRAYFNSAGLLVGNIKNHRSEESVAFSGRELFDAPAHAPVQTPAVAPRTPSPERTPDAGVVAKMEAAWSSGQRVETIPAPHPYAGLPAAGYRINGRGNIIVPVGRLQQNGEVEWTGGQFVNADGSKIHMAGIIKQGAFATVPATVGGDDREAAVRAALAAPELGICEGIGTALAFHRATGIPVLAVFDAGNLEPVSSSLAPHYAGQLIYVMDRDPARDIAERKGTGMNGQIDALAAGLHHPNADYVIFGDPGEKVDARDVSPETVRKVLATGRLKRAPARDHFMQHATPAALRRLQEKEQSMQPNEPQQTPAASEPADTRTLESEMAKLKEVTAALNAGFNQEREILANMPVTRDAAAAFEPAELPHLADTIRDMEPVTAENPFWTRHDLPADPQAMAANIKESLATIAAEIDRQAQVQAVANGPTPEATPEPATAPEKDAAQEHSTEVGSEVPAPPPTAATATEQAPEAAKDAAPEQAPTPADEVAQTRRQQAWTDHLPEIEQAREARAAELREQGLPDVIVNSLAAHEAARRLEELDASLSRGPEASTIDPNAPAMTGRRVGDLSPLTFEGLETKIVKDPPAVHYRRAAQDVFVDVGYRVDVLAVQSDREIEAALRLSAQKFDMNKGLLLTGSAEFKERAARIAGRLGYKIQNTELQQIWEQGANPAQIRGELSHLDVRDPTTKLPTDPAMRAESAAAKLAPTELEALARLEAGKPVSPAQLEALEREGLVDPAATLTEAGTLAARAEHDRTQQALRSRNVDADLVRDDKQHAEAHVTEEIAEAREHQRQQGREFTRREPRLDLSEDLAR